MAEVVSIVRFGDVAKGDVAKSGPEWMHLQYIGSAPPARAIEARIRGAGFPFRVTERLSDSNRQVVDWFFRLEDALECASGSPTP